MNYCNEAKISLDVKDPEVLCNSLSVEGKRNIPRTEVEINCSEGGIEIAIKATDFNALRAAISSYMRWINLAMEILEMV